MEIDKNQSKHATKKQWSRETTVTQVINFEQRRATESQRQFSASEGIPRSTLRYWITRKNKVNADESVVDFFESPEGLALLHRLINSAHMAFCKVGTASINNMCEFLKLSGLSAFVASSYGSQQQLSDQMDQAINEFSVKTTSDLSKRMIAKNITVCEDETFHPEICMVAMEPVSNFILLEQYAKDRRGQTWNNLLTSALEPLPVTVVQSTSDEGSGLLNHVKNGLKVHHSPDLFHVTYEISKGCSAAMSSHVKKAERHYQKKIELAQKAHYEKEAALQKKSKSDKDYIQLFDQDIETTQVLERQALHALDEAKANQCTVQESRLEIGEIYHPYHLETGALQSPREIEERLQKTFAKIYDATTSLSYKAKKRIDKAWKLIEPMKATMAFFFVTVQSLIEQQQLPPEIENILLQQWIPGLYFQMTARKQRCLEKRQQLEKLSSSHLSFLQQDQFFNAYDSQDRQRFEKLALECAGLFQRSSSCVEGRNAQLSLRHHHLHRLSHKKLSASTAIHNFHIRRKDGSTAAQRFFENKHQNLFHWVLDHMDIPVRPRAKICAKNMALAS